ncbi:MAG: RNA 3'-phosphate cyclase [Planctomycetes bacterium]|nr:RNA 3'-phosphate cyclase [Planctomycetota bacterium]
MIEIDGSEGEGGGQVLRTALALSIVTGRAFRAYNIRARRKNPGLQRQHLAAVRAAREVCGGGVKGDWPGSRELVFGPGPAQPGRYAFDIGSAGSATLVLQTVLYPLWQAGGASEVEIAGGTHNPMAPPFDFIAESFLPWLERAGARVVAGLERPGFYPAGGGRVRAEIRTQAPAGEARAEKLAGVELHARVMLARLPDSVAERELRVLQNALGLRPEHGRIERHEAASPGNVVMVLIRHAHGVELVSVLGRRAARPKTWQPRPRARRAPFWMPARRWANTWPTSCCCRWRWAPAEVLSPGRSAATRARTWPRSRCFWATVLPWNRWPAAAIA